jgi:hypothetical protein
MQVPLNTCCIGGPCVEQPVLDLAQVFVLAVLSLAGALIVLASTAYAWV